MNTESLFKKFVIALSPSGRMLPDIPFTHAKPGPLAVGLASFLGLSKLFQRENGGACSARYCYSVWLRFLVKTRGQFSDGIPAVVAELGPGDSLGTGFAALLSGASTYLALDAVSYANNAKNLTIFDELVELFRQRARIPDEKEFPLIRPLLNAYDFPADILTAERLDAALSSERIARLRAAVKHGASPENFIRYVVPWMGKENLPAGSVDFVFSQAVMEHVDDVQTAYACIQRWLRPTGVTAHTIDFKSHNLTREWNAHWALGDLMWRAIRGRRPYLLNRKTFTEHTDLLDENGLSVIREERYTQSSAMRRFDLADRFKRMSDEDMRTSEGFIVARRRPVG